MNETVIRSRWVMAGRVRTHYSEAGHNGPPLVMLHGGTPGSSGESWFAPVMPALGEHFRVYAPDGVGGFGRTDPYVPATEGAQSRVDQLEAFVDALCLDQIYLVGCSEGAWIGAKYSVEHPDRVMKLCIADSQTLCESMGIWKHVRRFEWKGDVTPELMRTNLSRQIVDKSRITDELVQMRTSAANRPESQHALKVYRDGGERLKEDPNLRLKFDLSYTLPRLRIPAMGMWGDHDASVPPEIARKLVELLPNIPFHFIKDSGHQMAYDQPKLMTDMLIDFFKS